MEDSKKRVDLSLDDLSNVAGGDSSDDTKVTYLANACPNCRSYTLTQIASKTEIRVLCSTCGYLKTTPV